MDHLQQSRLNLLTSHSLDRAALVRLDEENLGQRIMSENARFIGVHHLQIAIDEENSSARPALLTRREAQQRFGHCEPWVYLGREDSKDYFAVLLDNGRPRETHGFAELRALAATTDGAKATLLAYARAMAAWHQRHLYCSRCGGETVSQHGGHVRACTHASCGEQHYPRTDPAIIVLVEKGERALFGRKPEWSEHRYSTLAGFVEPGESAEQALVREVMEETGVEVLSAHYHSSQPWPFPGSLMLGYSAQAGSEKISLNDQELEHACWLDRDEITSRMQQGLFVLPPPISISFRLIEDWFDQHSAIPLRKLREDTGATHF